MEDTLNEFTEESLEEWEESHAMDTWEAAFIRGTEKSFADEEPELAEEEI